MTNPFEVLERETMKLLKKDGSVIDGLRTSGIHAGQVTFFREDVDFEEGDVIERQLPNGRIEKYLIDDVKFSAGLDIIPGHYILDISNVAKPKLRETRDSVVYNLNGANSRVNVHSNDHSNNSVNIDPDDLFNKIESILTASVEDAQELEGLRQQINQMKQNQGKPGFTDSYVRFLGIAADHLTLLTPLLPVLSQMLTIRNS